MNALIIESPGRQGIMRRLVQGLITLGFWGLLVYLLLPLFMPLLVAAGIVAETPVAGGAGSGAEIFYVLMLLVGGAMFGFGLWAEYNALLHRHRERKAPAPLRAICEQELANHFNVNPVELADWQRSGQLTIRLTEQGGIYCIAD